jgi:two-component system, OmpR family, response regulator
MVVAVREESDAPGPPRRHTPLPFWATAEGGLLLADEDPAAFADLQRLTTPHLHATVCGDGAEALWQAGRLGPSVVVLSATLPVVSAADVAAVLARHGGGVDIIAVGVGAGQTERAGPVLAAGARRVVSRPYRAAEIDPLLRERRERRGPGAVASSFAVGPLELDGPSFEVRVAGRPVHLTLREFELLRILMSRAGSVVPHEEVRRQLGQARGADVSRDTLAVHVRHLRARLGGVADILAVRGLGYRLRVRTAGTDQEEWT